MDELRIEYIDIDKITPYENNARKHQKADVDAIKKSIEAFGMNDPIGVWSDVNSKIRITKLVQITITNNGNI